MQNRLLRPFAAHLSSPLIWRMNRRGVARGAALGLFAAFAVPVAQTPFAALFAVAARANLPVAALATFVTNPLTVPFIYFAAYLAGRFMLRMNADVQATISPEVGQFEQWFNGLVMLAGPTYLGLLLFAVLAAIIGYVGVHLGWRYWIVTRWNHRRQRRRVIGTAARGKVEV